MHTWPLQYLSQDSNLAFHTAYLVYINFIHGWREIYSLKSTPNARLLREYSQSFCPKYAEGSRQRNHLKELWFWLVCNRHSSRDLFENLFFFNKRYSGRCCSSPIFDNFKPSLLKISFWSLLHLLFQEF